jgi:enoyl-CoA hydratase
VNDVLVGRRGAIVTVTINRPAAHNALNACVLAGLTGAVSAAADDPAVRAVVVTGSGDKAFSAGADLKEISVMGPDQAHLAMETGQDAFRVIERSGVPVIAAVNGLALGGGFELVLVSTFPVLSERAVLALPESGLGLVPGFGGTQRLPHAVGRRIAAHLMLTGHRLTASRAYDLGLTPVPPTAHAELLATAFQLGDRIAAQGPRAVRAILRAVEIGQDSSLDAGLAAETGLAALAIAGEESTEGITAFLARRPPSFAALEVSQ